MRLDLIAKHYNSNLLFLLVEKSSIKLGLVFIINNNIAK